MNDQKTILLKPQTFMNLSGEAVQAAANFFKIDLADVVVIHDEADLPFGEMKIEADRSAAGHNGVQSIIDAFGGSKEFTRVRFGVGRGENKNVPLDAFVLQTWTDKEQEQLPALIEQATRAIK